MTLSGFELKMQRNWINKATHFAEFDHHNSFLTLGKMKANQPQWALNSGLVLYLSDHSTTLTIWRGTVRVYAYSTCQKWLSKIPQSWKWVWITLNKVVLYMQYLRVGWSHGWSLDLDHKSTVRIHLVLNNNHNNNSHNTIMQ